MSMISNPAAEDRMVKALRPKSLSATLSRRAGLSTLLIGFFLASALPLSAAVLVADFNSGFENNGVVTDGSLSPWTDTRTISGIAAPGISDLQVRLNLSGGFNGDLYAYLSYNGVSVPLLNRVGVGTGNNAGYSDSGMNVTFTDDATDNIHFYQNVAGFSVSGGAQWKPDGRAINPLSSAASFDAAGTVMLSAFDGMNPNGDWTLVIADVSGGGGQTTVISWGLTAVPEPASMGLTFALALLTLPLAKHWRARRNQS